MNLVSTTVRNTFTGIFANHFDTFANTGIGQSCIISKEPIKTMSYSGISMPGYNRPVSTSYTPVSGLFPCIVVPRTNNKDGQDAKINLKYTNDEINIKLNSDGHRFMSSGKTISVFVNNRFYNQFSLDRTQDYFGLVYYYYNLVGAD